MDAERWRVRLAAAAEADFRQIVRWTKDNFGSAQARTYADTLGSALKDLADGPSVPGVRDRPEIGTDIRTLHVARKGRKGRHFILFRVSQGGGQNFIDVLRLLHDSMELTRHLPPRESG